MGEFIIEYDYKGDHFIVEGITDRKKATEEKEYIEKLYKINAVIKPI